MVALLKPAQKILTKMQYSNQPAYTKVSSLLAQLQAELAECMVKMWVMEKIFPEKFCRVTDLNNILVLKSQASTNEDQELAGQDLWSTLHLVLGRLARCNAVKTVNSLKDPRGAVPPELWIGFQQEVGPFPSRVGELIKALSGDEFPSFQELLKIFCGGNLSQACSVCSTRIDVAAVDGEVKGCFVGIPVVSILPFLPPLFNCGAKTCKVKNRSKKDAFTQMFLGIGATWVRLQSMSCDYCFMMAEKVHRYTW